MTREQKELKIQRWLTLILQLTGNAPSLKECRSLLLFKYGESVVSINEMLAGKGKPIRPWDKEHVKEWYEQNQESIQGLAEEMVEANNKVTKIMAIELAKTLEDVDVKWLHEAVRNPGFERIVSGLSIATPQFQQERALALRPIIGKLHRL